MKPEFSFETLGKTGKVVKYSLIGLTVGVLGAGILSLFTGGMFTDPVNFVEEPFVEKQSVAGKDVKRIFVSTGSTDVRITPGTGDEVSVELKGNGDLEEIKKGYDFTVVQDGDTARIEFKKKDGFSFRLDFFKWNNSRNLEITVPKKLYETIEVEVASGDVQVQDFQTNNMKLEAQSGDLSLRNIETQFTNIRVASGDVRVDGFKGESLTTEAQSGDMELANIAGIVQARTSSGDIDLKMAELSRDIVIEVSSGDVNVSAPQASSFDYEIEVASGDIDVNFGDQKSGEDPGHSMMGKVGAGGPKVQMVSSSGDVRLSAY